MRITRVFGMIKASVFRSQRSNALLKVFERRDRYRSVEAPIRQTLRAT